MAKPNKTVTDLQSELSSARTHLASTVDELAFRSQPKEIMRRQVEAVRVSIDDAIRTPEGDLRTDRIAMVVGGVAALILTLGVLKKVRG